MMEQTRPRIRLFGILLKAALLFALFNVAFLLREDARWRSITEVPKAAAELVNIVHDNNFL
jgi:hypothetical protein